MKESPKAGERKYRKLDEKRSFVFCSSKANLNSLLALVGRRIDRQLVILIAISLTILLAIVISMVYSVF